MCGADCAWCVYKQARYRQGFAKLCYEWFREKKIEKRCRTCRFYLEQRELNPALPEDPSWHPGHFDTPAATQ